MTFLRWISRLAPAVGVVLALILPGAAGAQSVTIPLTTDLEYPSSGFSNYVTVSVGGGPASQVLLDTGSTGLRFLQSQLGPNVTEYPNSQVTYGYSSGNELIGYLGQAAISFPDASSPISTPATTYFQIVTQVTCKSGYNNDCPGWVAGQSGVMGVAYDNDQIFNPLAQLSGVLGNGFIIVSNDLTNPNATPMLVVGLTPANMQGFVFSQMASTSGGLQPAGLNVWNTKSIYTCFAVNNGAPGCYDTVFDTGAAAGSFETGSGTSYGPVAAGSTVTITVPETLSLSLTAGSTPNTNQFFYATPHGGTPGYNSGAEVYRYYAILFDAQTGQIGFSQIANWLFGTIAPASDAALGTAGGAIALGGTLQLPDGFTSSRAIYLISDAALQALGGTATLSGTITGSSALTIAGPGTLALTGDSLYSGTASVTAGATLQVDGVFPGSVLLYPGTTLSGTGSIAALAAAAGSVVAPGTPASALTGTLSVAGAVAFAPGATLAVRLGPPGVSGALAASGPAMLAGTLAVAPGPAFSPLGGARYTILTAAGGISGGFTAFSLPAGMFGTAGSTYPFLTPQLGGGANALTLTLARSAVPFTSAALTANQAAVAAAADATGIGNGLVAALAGLNAASLPAALPLASGQSYASLQTLLQQNSAALRDATTARLRQAAPGAAAEPGASLATAALLPAAPDKATLWTQAYGGGGHLAGTADAAPLRAAGGGFFMGLDAPFGPAWRAGLAGGYANSGFSATSLATSGNIASYTLAAYAGAHDGIFSLDLGGGYSWNNIAATRSVIFANYASHLRGDTQAGTGQIYAEAAARLKFSALTVAPLADLAFVTTQGDGFTESGGSAALSAQSTRFNTGFSALGALLAKRFTPGPGESLDLTARLGWQHGFGDLQPAASFAFSGGGAAFTVTGAPLARNAALLTAGIGYHPSPTVTLSLAYSGTLAPAAQYSGITGSFRMSF